MLRDTIFSCYIWETVKYRSDICYSRVLWLLYSQYFLGSTPRIFEKSFSMESSQRNLGVWPTKWSFALWILVLFNHSPATSDLPILAVSFLFRSQCQFVQFHVWTVPLSAIHFLPFLHFMLIYGLLYFVITGTYLNYLFSNLIPLVFFGDQQKCDPHHVTIMVV